MTKFFFKDQPIIGLDISQTSIKVMAIDAKRLTVTGYGSVDLDPAQSLRAIEGNSDYLSENIIELLKTKRIGKLPSNHTILGLPTYKTYNRTFLLPAKSAKDVQNAIALEVEQYIPVPISQLYIDHQIIEKEGDNLVIQLCAIPRAVMDSCVDGAQNAGLEVIMVEPSVNAISRLLAFTEDGTLPTVIVDIGPASTDIAVLDKAIRINGSTLVGGNTLTLDIAKKLKVPLENAHQLKVQHGLNVSPRQTKILEAIEPSLKKIVSEIEKVLRYYRERMKSEKKIEQVIVVGGGSNVPGLGDYFTNSLLMPSRVASPWQILNFGNLEEPARQFKSRYITVAGLASVQPEEVF
jgi:type IV pilus assembly protein PilM